MLNNTQISYEADIKPWAGGIMIAMLPIYSQEEANGMMGQGGIKFIKMPKCS